MADDRNNIKTPVAREGALIVEEGGDFDDGLDEGVQGRAEEGDFDGDDGPDGPRRGRGTPGDGKAERAAEALSEILRRMDVDVRATIREDGEHVVLDVDGQDVGRAIGKKGQTLDALQFLVNKMMTQVPGGRRHIIVDSGDYRERHEEGLMSLARREAKRAVHMGKVITLEPMPPRDRRIIHTSLAKYPGVSTRSNGEGAGRRIQIIPANQNRGSKRPPDNDEPVRRIRRED